MLRKKGSLSGATLNGKIFAIGGGDGIECLSDVETFDPAIGKWYTNKPMLYKVNLIAPYLLFRVVSRLCCYLVLQLFLPTCKPIFLEVFLNYSLCCKFFMHKSQNLVLWLTLCLGDDHYPMFTSLSSSQFIWTSYFYEFFDAPGLQKLKF